MHTTIKHSSAKSNMKHRLRFPFLSLVSIAIHLLLHFQCQAWAPSSSLQKKSATPITKTNPTTSSLSQPPQTPKDRRQFISQIATLSSSIPFIHTLLFIPPNANAQSTTTSIGGEGNDNIIFTSGYGKEEYTNSITASRDTNISPKEVYDSIRSSYISYPIEQLQKRNDTRIPRAFDVGAGAGVSTQTLYLMGYKSIEAVDWSSKAWDDNVDDTLLPKGVNFHPVDDERFLKEYKKKNDSTEDGTGIELFDVIVFNFAVNDSKARSYAKTLLQPDGRLLAPVNTQSDYWLKQAFKVYDNKGNVLWTAGDVGAWSVQFQPDVTQDTCQGIWCAPYNGFQKKR